MTPTRRHFYLQTVVDSSERCHEVLAAGNASTNLLSYVHRHPKIQKSMNQAGKLCGEKERMCESWLD